MSDYPWLGQLGIFSSRFSCASFDRLCSSYHCEVNVKLVSWIISVDRPSASCLAPLGLATNAGTQGAEKSTSQEHISRLHRFAARSRSCGSGEAQYRRVLDHTRLFWLIEKVVSYLFDLLEEWGVFVFPTRRPWCWQRILRNAKHPPGLAPIRNGSICLCHDGTRCWILLQTSYHWLESEVRLYNLPLRFWTHGFLLCLPVNLKVEFYTSGVLPFVRKPIGAWHRHGG